MLSSFPVMAEKRLTVFASIVPQQYFLEQIGKDLLDIHVMVPPGANPATYEPKPKQMVMLSHASAYFAVGVPFENAWLKKLISINPDMIVVHTEEGIKKLPMKTPFPSFSENDKNKNTGYHGIFDPHIWLSPPLVLQQARTMLNALCALDPKNSPVYEANFKNFAFRVKRLHIDLKKKFQVKESIKFMVFHPAWGYFATTYGLKQIPIQIEGKAPKPEELKRLIKYAKKNDIGIIFVQPQISPTNAQVIAKEIGAQIAYADPLAADWMANMKKVANQFMSALKCHLEK
jgi:zinc transport system substrate-binding protein